jgi:hypothetical protein
MHEAGYHEGLLWGIKTSSGHPVQGAALGSVKGPSPGRKGIGETRR